MVLRGGISPASIRQGANANRYRLTADLAGIGGDFAIENALGQAVFFVDGRALHDQSVIAIMDRQGRRLYHAQALALGDGADLAVWRDLVIAATIKIDSVAPDRQYWSVETPAAPATSLKGRIADHEYLMVRAGQKIAEVSRQWFHISNSYGVEITPGQDNALIIAIAIAIGSMTHG
jgi:uncharacterized protein YxjI